MTVMSKVEDVNGCVECCGFSDNDSERDFLAFMVLYISI